MQRGHSKSDTVRTARVFSPPGLRSPDTEKERMFPQEVFAPTGTEIKCPYLCRFHPPSSPLSPRPLQQRAGRRQPGTGWGSIHFPSPVSHWSPDGGSTVRTSAHSSELFFVCRVYLVRLPPPAGFSPVSRWMRKALVLSGSLGAAEVRDGTGLFQVLRYQLQDAGQLVWNQHALRLQDLQVVSTHDSHTGLIILVI